MKSKATLVLMEQLVMVLVFAVAAALCLNVFVSADRISQETARRDEAVLLARNAAQVLKSCGGDPERAAKLLGASVEAKKLTVQTSGFIMEVDLLEPEIPGLGQARICVFSEGVALAGFETGWQEGQS